MKIKNILISFYELPLIVGGIRQGAIVKIENSEGHCGWGDIAPLPQRSLESLHDAITQLEQIRNQLYTATWEMDTFLKTLSLFNLFPSVSFALECALFSIMAPLPACSLAVSTLLMGSSLANILEVAHAKKVEGYTSAKLKVGNLSLKEAHMAITALKDMFKLRIDVNSAWNNTDVLRFFSQFPLDTFDYVEDPLSDLSLLDQFHHPIAIEEPLSKGFSVSYFASLPTLKAIIYKPTVHGGFLIGKSLQQWAKQHGKSVVLSSSFESDLGLLNLAAVASRLDLTLPIGIGTYHYLGKCLLAQPLQLSHGQIHLSPQSFLI